MSGRYLVSFWEEIQHREVQIQWRGEEYPDVSKRFDQRMPLILVDELLIQIVW